MAAAFKQVTLITGFGLLAACGYSVLGGAAPYSCHRLEILPFAELEPNGVAAPMAVALSRRVAAGGARVVTGGTSAQGFLSGTVHVANAPSATPRSVEVYAVIVTVHAVLRDGTGNLLWAHDVQLKEEFLPTNPIFGLQPLVTEARRRTALVRLAERAAYAVHDALLLDSSLATTEVQTP